MLRYSSWPLPAEIYAMIFSHLSVNHLAAIQKTCRGLFLITTPYVWQSVDIESILRLLPGCASELGETPKLEITTPCPIPDDYFDRFFYYSRFVKCVKITPQFIISGSFQEDQTEMAVLASTTGHLTLSNVGAIELKMILGHPKRRYRDEYADYKFWIEALIPRTIKRISFEAFSNHDESLLETLIAKAPELTHLDFASEPLTSHFYENIGGSNPMRNIRCLHYSGSIMDPDVLQWFAAMPQLATLELTLDQGDSEEPSVPELSYEPEAFRALTTLKVFTCDHEEITEQWNLIRQLWKTPLVRHLTCAEIKLSEPIYPEMKEVDRFIAVLSSHSPRISSLRLGASGRSEHFPEISVEFLSELRQLSLRTLDLQSPIYLKANQMLFKTMGCTFPKLVDLDLSSTSIEILDILNAQNHLPNLRYLSVGAWQTKSNKKRLDITIFSERNPHFIDVTQPPCSSSLSLCFRERRLAPGVPAYNLDFSDVDLIAM